MLERLRELLSEELQECRGGREGDGEGRKVGEVGEMPSDGS
jgi:hypothetical protein